MKKLSSILTLLLLMILLFSAGCSKKNTPAAQAPSSQGGQDSGGGDTSKSRIALIKHYLKDEATLKIKLERVVTVRMREFGLDLNFKSINTSYQKLQQEFVDKVHVYVKKYGVTKLQREPSRQFKNMALSSYAVDSNEPVIYHIPNPVAATRESLESEKAGTYATLISKIKINILSDRHCEDKYKKQKAGTANSFDFSNPEICISELAFVNIPESSLEGEIYALLFHEFSHLIGFLEDDAQSLQNNFLSTYASSEMYLKKESFQNSYIAVFLKDLSYFAKAIIETYPLEQFKTTYTLAYSPLHEFIFSFTRQIRKINISAISIEKGLDIDLIKAESSDIEAKKAYLEKVLTITSELEAIADVYLGVIHSDYYSRDFKDDVCQSDFLRKSLEDITNQLENEKIPSARNIYKENNKTKIENLLDRCEDHIDIKDSDIEFIYNRLKFLVPKIDAIASDYYKFQK